VDDRGRLLSPIVQYKTDH